MVIENIYINNIGMLYSATIPRNTQGTYDSARTFTKELPNVYGKAFITFKISELTLLELFMMKKFSSNIFTDNKLIWNDYDDEELKSVIVLNQAIVSDNDIPVKLDILGSADMIESNALITFTGSQLSSIITLSPAEFFIKALNLDKDKCPVELPNDEESLIKIKDALIQSLINNFYKFCADSFTSIDVCSNAVNKSFYHDYSSIDKQVSLIEFSTPTGMVNMSTDLDGFNVNRANCLLFNEYNQNLSTDEFIKNIKLTFSITSSLSTFIHLYTNTPNGMITDHSHLNTVIYDTGVNYEDDIMYRQYAVRLQAKKNILENRLNELYNTGKEKLLQKYFAIPLYRTIGFTLSASLYDLNYELPIIINKLKDIVPDNTLTSNEINNITNSIIRYTKMVYKNLVLYK